MMKIIFRTNLFLGFTGLTPKLQIKYITSLNTY